MPARPPRSRGGPGQLTHGTVEAVVPVSTAGTVGAALRFAVEPDGRVAPVAGADVGPGGVGLEAAEIVFET